MLGQIVLFGGNFAPRGWAFCDGRLMPISQNAALFSLLGTTFGGNGRTDFALPDLRPKPPSKDPSPNYIIALQGTFPTRD